MFTGIVEEMGIIKKVEQSGNAIDMSIKAEAVMTDLQLGDSVAVNGVCVTVKALLDDGFSVDLMPETVQTTSLRDSSPGSRVNLERALAAQDRFGGHFVTGHVDGTGMISKITPVDNAVYMDLRIPSELSDELVSKGSITVDGVSLTVFGVTNDEVTISLIPHTQENTIFADKTVDDTVNIETDILGKYIKKATQPYTSFSRGDEADV
ncbi:riboflavin synthase [Tuberibacillus sp. Marseille-P3662]|uniref:riboflavin synthase n=1 Tax=Tuberibacillus sp. Marseille-P3662 TaxID=1965358 RepID=UPI000A1CA117|nr:riboflavin synthase [Tuberibacillus sp. Marseille-P3662]